MSPEPAARAAGDDAEAAGRAPRAAHVAGGDRGDAPEEGALALDAEGGAGGAAVGGVDDVVDEEPVAGDLQGIALATRHPLPRQPHLLDPVVVEIGVLLRPGEPGRARQRLDRRQLVGLLPHRLQRIHLPRLGAGLDLHAAAVGGEAPLALALVVGDDRLRLVGDHRLRLRRRHPAAALRRVEVDPAVLEAHLLALLAGGARADQEEGVGAHRVERAVAEHDLGRAGGAGLHVVARTQGDAAARLLPLGAVGAAVLDAPLHGDELRLAAVAGVARGVEERAQHLAAALGLRQRLLVVGPRVESARLLDAGPGRVVLGLEAGEATLAAQALEEHAGVVDGAPLPRAGWRSAPRRGSRRSPRRRRPGAGRRSPSRGAFRPRPCTSPGAWQLCVPGSNRGASTRAGI